MPLLTGNSTVGELKTRINDIDSRTDATTLANAVAIASNDRIVFYDMSLAQSYRVDISNFLNSAILVSNTATLRNSLGLGPSSTLFAANWAMFDSSEGLIEGLGSTAYLIPNLSNALTSVSNYITKRSTGFQINAADDVFNTSGSTYVYMAIRTTM